MLRDEIIIIRKQKRYFIVWVLYDCNGWLIMLIEKLEAIKERFHYLEEKLSDPETVKDMKQFTKVNKEYSSLKEIVSVGDDYARLLGNIETAQEMLKDSDPEMKEMAQMELEELKPRQESMEDQIKVLLIPKDPEDSKDVVFEIRSGAGGDEAR